MPAIAAGDHKPGAAGAYDQCALRCFEEGEL